MSQEAYLCPGCSAMLFFEKPRDFSPCCTQCRSMMRKTPVTPDALVYFSCQNCKTAFGMKQDKSPYTCPQCNASKFDTFDPSKGEHPPQESPNQKPSIFLKSTQGPSLFPESTQRPSIFLESTQKPPLFPESTKQIPKGATAQLTASTIQNHKNPDSTDLLDVLTRRLFFVVAPALFGAIFGTTGFLIGLGTGLLAVFAWSFFHS